jgi:hypothetical protein
MFTTQQFRAEIEAFLKRNKHLTPTVFGRLVARDGNLVGDIVAGRKPSLRTVERVGEFIKAHDGKLSPERIKHLFDLQPDEARAARKAGKAEARATARKLIHRKTRRLPSATASGRGNAKHS